MKSAAGPSKTKSWISAHGISLRISALCHSVLGDRQKAESDFQASIDLLSKCGRKYDMAKSLMEYGLFLERAGRKDEMHGRLEAAYRIFMEIGSDSYVKSVSRKLGSAGMIMNCQIVRATRTSRGYLVTISGDITSILILTPDQGDEQMRPVTAHRGLLSLKMQTGSYDLRVSVGHGGIDSQYIKKRVKWRLIPPGRVTATQKTRIIFRHTRASLLQAQVNSLRPIRRRNETVGVCYLDNSLSSGVFTEDDRDILNLYMSQAAIAIDNAFFYSNLEKKIRDRTSELNIAKDELDNAYTSVSKAFEIIKEDLSIARKVQQSVLPRNIERIEGFSFFVRYLPMSDIGGDIYDITEIGSGAVRVFIADATGHGIQASLVTMLLMGEYNKIKKSAESPEVVLGILNEFFSKLSSMKAVFTCAVADIRPSEGIVSFASAGHPAQYLIKSGAIVEMERTGRIIGMLADSAYSRAEYPISRGDCFLFLTDGVYEHFNENRQTYGEGRMKEIIRKSTGRSPEEIFQEISADVDAFLRGDKKMNDDDDVTLIGVRLR